MAGNVAAKGRLEAALDVDASMVDGMSDDGDSSYGDLILVTW